MKFSKKLLILSILIISIFTLGGCSKSVDTTLLTSYSNEKAEHLLKALNDNDYEAFSKDFNENLKKSYPKDVFESQSKIIKDTVGNYKDSLKFSNAESKKGFINATYKANFEKENDVLVSIVFEEDDESHQIQGLMFQSPKLVEAAKEAEKSKK